MALPRLMHRWARLGLPLMLLAPAPLRAQLSEAAPEAARAGLLTIESDQQSSDNITGVITASGNVRIVHPDRGLMATGRQAQYFSKEQRIVLSGDVDVIQAGARSLRAEQVTVLLDQQRTVAIPTPGQQVISRIALTGEGDGDTP